jgi:cell division protein FtsL
MMTEYMSIQGLQTVSLELTPTEMWESARHFLNTASVTEVWSLVFAVVVLIISVLIVFWLVARHKQLHRLKRKIAELTSANEKLRQEIAELNGEEIEILESIIDAKPPKRVVPGFNPQELKALAELARRLR